MGLVAVFRSRVPGAWSARNETRDARRKKACVAPRGQTAQSAAPCGAIPAARGSDPDFASLHPGCRATRLARVFPFHDVKRAQSSSFPPHPASAVAQRIGKRRVLAFSAGDDGGRGPPEDLRCPKKIAMCDLFAGCRNKGPQSACKKETYKIR